MQLFSCLQWFFEDATFFCWLMLSCHHGRLCCSASTVPLPCDAAARDGHILFCGQAVLVCVPGWGHCLGRSQSFIFAWRSALDLCQDKRTCRIALQRFVVIGVLASRLEAYGRHQQRGVPAPQSQPSLGCCPSVCTKAHIDCRPLEYRRPHSAMSLSVTPPHILCLWQKWHRLDQTLIFTGLQWYTGLVAPCASLTLPAGGCILAFDRPSMFLFFLCVRTRTRAMMVSPWFSRQ